MRVLEPQHPGGCSQIPHPQNLCAIMLFRCVVIVCHTEKVTHTLADCLLALLSQLGAPFSLSSVPTFLLPTSLSSPAAPSRYSSLTLAQH